MNGADDREENNLKGFYGYRETFGEGSVWVQVPKQQVTFVDNSDPYNQPPSPTLEAFATTMEQAGRHPQGYPGADWPISGPPSHAHNNSSTHGLEALSAAASGDHYSYVPPQAHMMRQDIAYSPVEGTSSMPTTTPARSVTDPLSPQASVAPSHNLRFILNPSSAASTPIDPSLRSPFERMSTYHQRSVSRGILIDPQLEEKALQEHEIAFLLRHFSEGPGQWMDLFDLGTFFASDVPVKAVSNNLLKYAAVAYAAKALGRVHGRKPVMGGPASRQAEIEVFPNSDQVDWFHKGAKYYDVAVSLLRQALQDDTGSLSRRSAEDVELGSAMESQGIEDQAILCVYEFLDASGTEWSGHLNGAKSLIDIAKDSMMPLQLPSPDPTLQSRLRISKARKATFWNIARQDMLAAFINNSHTRLNPEELSLWKEAGLMIDDQGYIVPSNTTESGLPEGESVMREDMISNALIWLVSKLVNYMAAGDQLPPEFAPFGSAVPQRSLLEYWYHLRNQFQVWFDGLPLPFKPVAIISPTNDSNDIEAEARLPEVCFCTTSLTSRPKVLQASMLVITLTSQSWRTLKRTVVAFLRLRLGAQKRLSGYTLFNHSTLRAIVLMTQENVD
ncbi:hypothetical protein B0A49_03652 [Cryomyces minteri]|uniref:Transcription factor domain-containing protein n=1 Tax=Cryomyces minteri TaxID=331657 RepID=A0A4V5NHT2_9PEZI|nr:hypothetical protein B0A49_03652 [Cryomyces minteri]